MSARDEILGRIRGAVGPAPAVPPVPRDYDVSGGHITEPMELLADRLRDYAATVFTCAPADLDERLADITRGWRVAVPAQARFAVPGAVRDDPPLPYSDLDAVDAVLTGCAAACADTGTIALDAGPDQGRRALTLIPDRHVCVVHADQVVRSVPELVRRLDPHRPLTFISGPSATSDIELNRVEGVHGPRSLIVVLVDPVGSGSGRR
ncbi:LutC/YkgG family protein [Allorhizocola rhizosphaerae]|uniref:LutC/YkgG family protein n=1 Tax=Allorhizocola rhizosphaerae TaxID=1872709 RepID=UPI000E3C1143|nr:LUD domain-containing protein [Allorhizocola rhizosphaerae]